MGHIHIDSDFVDWILGINKDSGKPRIALFDNVHFYVGLRRTLNEAEKVGLVSDGKFCAKRTVSSFQDIQQSHNNFNGRVYALVDRNPRVHILFLIDTQLLAVFSLAMLINQKSGRKAVVMKGIDGSLYHSQHLAEELTFGKTILQFQAVYWIDAEMNKIPIEIPFESGDWPDVLSQICAKIVEASKEDRSASWLIELYMCPVAPCTQPALTEFKAWTKFLGQQTNPLVQAVVHGAEQTMV
ncbi:hypothetical protein B0J17DRAFT_346391 [Rhizoctonia solani]|nr:hypothetical protein B0J17DRAFT_346391 [Rhizoctonia solani]